MRTGKRINWRIVLFVAPGLVFFLLFRYVPIYFVQIAFRDFRITRSVGQAPWVGLKYFQQLFAMPGFTRCGWNWRYCRAAHHPVGSLDPGQSGHCRAHARAGLYTPAIRL